MKTSNSFVAWLGTVSMALPLTNCKDDAQPASNQVLDYGDAEWERPPFDPPGGNGQDPGDDGFGDDGGGPAGGTGSADEGGFDSTGDGLDTGDSTTADDPTTSDPTTGDASTGTSGDPTTGDASTGTTGGSSTGLMAEPASSDPDALAGRQPSTHAPAPECPAAKDPAVFYMSNDDSNSQASPVLARHAIMQGYIVDPYRVRIHEFLNYYDLSYANREDVAATVGLQMRRTNAELGEFVLLAYAQGRLLASEDRRPMNLVFSLDTSGSMEGEPMDRLKDSMRAIAGSLDRGDVVSAVTWSSDQVVPLDSHPVSGPDDPVLLAMIDALSTDGGTDLEAGLTKAYSLAEANYGADRLNRVVLISDGGANAGITDLDLIAQAAADSDGEGIYMVGVGVGDATGYRDDLMDAVTDAGKGAYLFVDTPSEADRAFGKHFVQTMDVAARNVQMELTMPWYFAITEFHGEEYSADPTEVEPQHLAPNDAMSYHQIIQACDPAQILTNDLVKARITYEHPITRAPMADELELPIGDIVRQDASQLYKGDVVVAFAQSLIVIGNHYGAGEIDQAQQVANDMVVWLATAADALGDPEIEEMHGLMQTYASNL